MKIKEIPTLDRPRERLLNMGVKYLSNEDLLAILLKTGNKKSNVKELALLLLKEVGEIPNLSDISYEQLAKIKGIGIAKATTILAAIELGKRINVKPLIRERLNSPEKIFNYYRYLIGSKKQEYFCCVYLDNQKRIIKDKIIFIGTLNFSPVHPREIFKEAYLLSASSFVCIHNHPSNNPIPSKEDIITTKRLSEIGKLLGIPLVDHIIIGIDNYYSMLEQGDIWKDMYI